MSQLVKLAIPIMATSFVQMTYTMVDIAWLGSLGSAAVASAGAASFFVWLGSFFLFCRMRNRFLQRFKFILDNLYEIKSR